jgi:hypothetical protein
LKSWFSTFSTIYGCRTFFILNLSKKQQDHNGRRIDSEYAPASIKGLIVGEDLKSPDAYGNTAAQDKVANPDNLSFSDDLNTLLC